MVPTAADSSDERGTRRGTILEVLLAFAIIVGFAAGYVPISEVPLLVLLGWLSLRRRKLDWSAVGLTRPAKPRRVALLTLTGIAYAVIALYIVDPFIDRISGPADLSDFADVRGNVGMLVFWIALSWILGAFGEELAYRGYLMSRIGGLLGQTANAWRLSLILTSVLFGIAHISEGTSGVISNILSGAVYGGLYLLAGRNLWAPILAHGFEDTIGFVLMFFGQYPGMSS